MIDELKNFVANGISTCKVMVVGDLMLDKYYFSEVTRISPEAPVPIAKIFKIDETLGGAANVAHNLALLGCKTSLIGQIGRDNHGEIFKNKLKVLGIDYSGVFDSEKPTTTKIRVISGHQQMIRLDFEDATALDTANERNLLEKFTERLSKVDVVIISDYGKGVCSKKVCREVINASRAAKKYVIVDPKGNNWQKYFDASFITPNLKEFNAILDKKVATDAEIEESARKVIEEYNLRGLLVTRSAKGLTLVADNKKAHIKARAQEVFDVSGAGDTVIAVFALGLAGKLDFEASAYLSNVAAGVVVAKVGTYALNRDELLNAL